MTQLIKTEVIVTDKAFEAGGFEIVRSAAELKAERKAMDAEALSIFREELRALLDTSPDITPVKIVEWIRRVMPC